MKFSNMFSYCRCNSSLAALVGRGGLGSGHDSQFGSGVSPVTTVPTNWGFPCSIVSGSVQRFAGSVQRGESGPIGFLIFVNFFHGFCDAYVAGPSTPLALPPPLAPATPRAPPHPRTPATTPRPRAPSGHSPPRHLRTQ